MPQHPVSSVRLMRLVNSRFDVAGIGFNPWSKHFAWLPVKLENNDYTKLYGLERWVWLKTVFKRRIYVHTGGLYPVVGYNVYSDNDD
jgi:hypothetical protein